MMIPWNAEKATMASGGKPASELQSELLLLRCRVEELERENERLRTLISSCQCSKAADSTCSTELSLQEANQCEESEVNESEESVRDSFFGHLHLDSANPPKDEAKLNTCSYRGNSDKSTKHGKIRGPGSQLRAINHQARRYIALKIMYFGQRFYGFASEAQMEPTIESEIFSALERTRLLLGNKEESQYSRCGRTDKGVSSTGQVISLYLRSKVMNSAMNNKNEKIISGDDCEEELDYARVLNRVLPKDIRVLGWCPVPTSFHARFSCLSREYQYHFWRGTLDILAMQKAANKFIGEHDFRNFCKMDAANVNNYTRKITNFEISSCNKRFDEDELWAMTISGSAFLWHQVRCIVAVLFMIGQGLESPEVVDVLLDVRKTPRKPQYNMAPDLPLVLSYCEFEDLNFICSSAARQALRKHLKNESRNFMLQAAIFHEALECLSVQEETSPSGGKKQKGHVPLMLRPTEPSLEERRAKLNVKATQTT